MLQYILTFIFKLKGSGKWVFAKGFWQALFLLVRCCGNNIHGILSAFIVSSYSIVGASAMRTQVFVKLANTGEIRTEYENELRKVSTNYYFQQTG